MVVGVARMLATRAGLVLDGCGEQFGVVLLSCEEDGEREHVQSGEL